MSVLATFSRLVRWSREVPEGYNCSRWELERQGQPNTAWRQGASKRWAELWQLLLAVERRALRLGNDRGTLVSMEDAAADLDSECQQFRLANLPGYYQWHFRRTKVSSKRRSMVIKAMVAAGVSVQQLLQEGNTAEQLAAAGVDVQPAAGAAAAGVGDAT